MYLLLAWQMESRHDELYDRNEHDSHRKRKSQSGSKSETLSKHSNEPPRQAPQKKRGFFKAFKKIKIHHEHFYSQFKLLEQR
jgi:hypothetical protein